MCDLVTTTLVWYHSNIRALMPLITLGQGRIKEGVPSQSASQVIRQPDKDPLLWQELKIRVTFKENLSFSCGPQSLSSILVELFYAIPCPLSPRASVSHFYPLAPVSFLIESFLRQ